MLEALRRGAAGPPARRLGRRRPGVGRRPARWSSTCSRDLRDSVVLRPDRAASRRDRRGHRRRQPRLLRDRGDPRARAAGRGRAARRATSRSTASRASPAPGARPTEATAFCQVAGASQPYSPTGHRHIAEIEQALARLAGEPGRPSPSRRTSRRTRAASRSRATRGCAAARAGRRRAPVPRRATPRSRSCDVDQSAAPGPLHGANAVPRRRLGRRAHADAIVAAAAIDNLVKGAAGQAIQNANLMLGLARAAWA